MEMHLPSNFISMKVEMFYLNSTLNFGIPPVLLFHLEVYYKVDRLLTAQQKGTTARWYSNKTSLSLLTLWPGTNLLRQQSGITAN